MAYEHRHMNPPSGPLMMIPAFVILGGISLVLMGGAQEWFKRGDHLYGWGALLGIVTIWAFLIFVLILHIRAGALWAWYTRTGRVPQPKKGGFWKGALIGAVLGFLGLMLAIKLTTGAQTINGRPMDANAWIVVSMVYGGMFFFPCVVVPAIVLGWAKRAWDRTAIPEPIQDVSGPGGSGWKNLK